MIYRGIDPHELQRILSAQVDHGGNPIEPYIVDSDGWTMRCCLTNSTPGDRVAMIAWSPMPWQGAYAETGPLLVHVDGCQAPTQRHDLPSELDARPMVLRPYGPNHTIAYHRVRHIAADESTAAHVAELLEFDDVEFVHARNVTGGCLAFTATRN